MKEQKKSYITAAGTKTQAKKHIAGAVEQINVPWSVSTEIQDGSGNLKQISAVGNAALSVSSEFKTFYEEYAETILSELITNFVQRFGWQFLKPEGEPIFTNFIGGSLQGVNLEKFGLISLREWDVEPSLNGTKFKKLGNGKTLYQNFSWNDNKTGPVASS